MNVFNVFSFQAEKVLDMYKRLGKVFLLFLSKNSKLPLKYMVFSALRCTRMTNGRCGKAHLFLKTSIRKELYYGDSYSNMVSLEFDSEHHYDCSGKES